MDFKDKLERFFRERPYVEKKGFAIACGIHPITIYKILNGGVTPQQSTIKVIEQEFEKNGFK